MTKLPETKPRHHNTWTRQKMVLFLRELAASQNVSQAAKSVGMSRQSAYKLRTRLKGTPFDLGWEVALEMGFDQLAHAIMDRALNGEDVPHYHQGELVGTHKRHDNLLARWVMENPWRLGRLQVAREYTTPGFDALLERIEWASFEWEEGESMPVPGGPIADRGEGDEREYNFVRRSWYAADAAYDSGGGDGRSRHRRGR